MANLKQIKVGNTTYNIEPYTSYLPLTGGTLSGALNFNNNTWNLVGDDVYIGDYNQAGSLGIKGKNGQTNIGFVNQSNDYCIKLASPGVSANRTITMPDDTGTIALTKNIPTSLPANGGNADTVDGKHSSDFCLSNSNITNLPINGGIYWNPYVESGSDGSDAASITVIKDGNGNGGTVLQIKQANDNNDIVNVVAGDLKLNGVSVSTNGHTHSSVADIGNSTATTFAYSKSGLNYGDYTWLAGWNGYELRAVNKSQFATSGHTHSNYVTTDTEQTISGKKKFTNNVTTTATMYSSSISASYIYPQGNSPLTISGLWDPNTQPKLEFASGKIRGYNWYDDGVDATDLSLQVEFPVGANIDITSGGCRVTAPSTIYINGHNGCYLESSSNGWKLAKNDNLGSIYADGNNYGRVGNKEHHFYEGYINNIYVNRIYPSSGGVGQTSGYNIGMVGDSHNYFATGAFKTIYRSTESGLSDIRLKQNISNNDLNALNIINNLNIINFQYDDDVKTEARNKKQRLKAINTMKELPKTKENKELRKELQKIIATPNNEDMITIGVSAQQLQELLPKKYQKTFIQKESTNQYADQLFIRENRLVYLSFKAIQEQQAIIGSLEGKINLLEEKINALEEKMKKEVN